MPIQNNTRTVGRNFVFMGLEVVIVLICTLLTTIFIARVIGPKRLGYFNLVMWMTSITCSVGSLGIPLTTFKYLGEFLGSGQKGLARAVFFYNLRTQIAVATCFCGIGLIAVLTLVDPEYRICSILLVASMLPNMVGFIPSQANTAAENSKVNTRAALIGAITYIVTVALSLLFGWDLIGIAAAFFLYCSTELILKLVPVINSMTTAPKVPLPSEIRKRMFTFSGLSTGLMVLQIVVWDRSDILFLTVLQPDIRQVAFFSVCFSVADRLMRMPQTFANALAATQMAEYGRDKDRLFRMTSQGFTYVLLGALPLLVGVACIGAPFVRVVYGSQYLPAIPVFILVMLFSLPKAVLTPAQTLLSSAEELGFILKWGCVAALINVILDLVLIPSRGATGAAWANGAAQTFAAAAIWFRVVRRYPVRIDKSVLLRLSAATAAMAVIVSAVVLMPISDVMRLIIAIPVGVLVFLITSRTFMVLQSEDRRRLIVFSKFMPGPVRPWFTRLIDFLIPISPVIEVSSQL
jgi:O-antigen/teichoic acid export membrane protein